MTSLGHHSCSDQSGLRAGARFFWTDWLWLAVGAATLGWGKVAPINWPMAQRAPASDHFLGVSILRAVRARLERAPDVEPDDKSRPRYFSWVFARFESARKPRRRARESAGRGAANACATVGAAGNFAEFGALLAGEVFRAGDFRARTRAAPLRTAGGGAAGAGMLRARPHAALNRPARRLWCHPTNG